MEITSQSKLLDVLEAYPELEAQIVNIAPPFQNLKNPLLRRTVGKLATLEQVAKIGGMNVDRLVNTLRVAVGQTELSSQQSDALIVEVSRSADDPDWIHGDPAITINGTALLERGEVPLVAVNERVRDLAEGQYLLLVTNFEPTPILEAMQKQGRGVHYKINAQDASQHLTFIR